MNVPHLPHAGAADDGKRSEVSFRHERQKGVLFTPETIYMGRESEGWGVVADRTGGGRLADDGNRSGGSFRHERRKGVLVTPEAI